MLGEQWVDHWGHHKSEATRAILEETAKGDPILNGVGDIFVTTDVYEAHPPADVKILFRGQALKGMNPDRSPRRLHAERTPCTRSRASTIR